MLKSKLKLKLKQKKCTEKKKLHFLDAPSNLQGKETESNYKAEDAKLLYI